MTVADSTASALDAMTAEQFCAPGRKTVVGYLFVMRGSFKRNYGNSLSGLIADNLRHRLEANGVPIKPGSKEFARWPDTHSVFFGKDDEKEPGKQLVTPLLRYKRSRPIDGLRSECNGHRVELTCTIGKDAAWKNGLGAYITRAQGRCLECEE